MERTPISQLRAGAPGQRVRVCGRVTQRGSGLWIGDESGGCVLEPGASPLAPGSLVELEATLSSSGALVDPDIVLVQAPALPFTDRADSDVRRVAARADKLRNRARIVRLIRGYFDDAGFLEVDTPLAVPSPGLDVHLDALRVHSSAGERYLITSPEYQMKRLLVGGLERIYQICKCFRNDEVGDRHQPEFTMLEWYRAFSGVEAVMRDTEVLVAEVARALSPDGRATLSTAFGSVDVTPPWPRLTVREAVRRYADCDMAELVEDEERFYRVLIEQVEPRLAELGAVFLCEYPASMASLARRKPDDPTVAERFEAYVAGIELCNGFGELTDASEQRARLVADQQTRRGLGLPVYPIDERFLRALEDGMPPSGGNALGLDRLVMLALGARHIEEVLAIGASVLD